MENIKESRAGVPNFKMNKSICRTDPKIYN